MECVRLASGDHGLFHLLLCLLDTESGELAADVLHLSGVESVLVDDVLGIDELRIPRLFDSQFVYDVLGWEVAVALHLDDGDWYCLVQDVLRESVFGDHLGVLLDGLQRDPIIGCVRRH